MGSLVTIPFFISKPILPVNIVEWIMIFGIILTSVAAQLLMNQGFYYCKGSEGAVYMSSKTVFSAIVGISFLNDPASWRFYTDASLILLSGILLNRLKIIEKN